MGGQRIGLLGQRRWHSWVAVLRVTGESAALLNVQPERLLRFGVWADGNAVGNLVNAGEGHQVRSVPKGNPMGHGLGRVMKWSQADLAREPDQRGRGACNCRDTSCLG